MTTRRPRGAVEDNGAGNGAAAGPGDRELLHWVPQPAFELRITERLPGADPAVLALFTYVLGAGRLVDAFQTHFTRRHGIDGAQLSVLMVLWFADPPHRRSPTVLHRLLVQSPGGMSHTLRRLEAAGLVARRTDDADGRALHVELTARGADVAAAVLADVAGALGDVFGAQERSDVRRLADAQRQVTEAFSRSPLSYPVTARVVRQAATPD